MHTPQASESSVAVTKYNVRMSISRRPKRLLISLARGLARRRREAAAPDGPWQKSHFCRFRPFLLLHAASRSGGKIYLAWHYATCTCPAPPMCVLFCSNQRARVCPPFPPYRKPCTVPALSSLRGSWPSQIKSCCRSVKVIVCEDALNAQHECQSLIIRSLKLGRTNPIPLQSKLLCLCLILQRLKNLMCHTY